MQRRLFLKALFGTLSALPFLTRPAASTAESKPAPKEILLQSSPVAGFQFYDGEELWGSLKPGDTMQLVAEPDNAHDQQAVKVMRGNRQLGYVPRNDNAIISQMLKRKQKLIARIAALQQSQDPWKRITIDILLVAG